MAISAWFVMMLTTVRIMFAGDSITAGYYSDDLGGFRKPLWSQFQSVGIPVDFVGSLDSPPVGNLDTDHEGHLGYTSAAVKAHMAGWLAATPADVVVLMVGNNDTLQQVPLATSMQNISDTIDIIGKDRRIVVVRPAPSSVVWIDQRLTVFAATEHALMSRKQHEGYRIEYVSTFAGFNTATDLVDGVHPNNAGFVKIAGSMWAQLSATVLQAATPSPACNPATSVAVLVQRVSPTTALVTVTANGPPVVVFETTRNAEPIADLTVNGNVATFTMRKIAASLSVHIPFRVTDACGMKRTFVGLG